MFVGHFVFMYDHIHPEGIRIEGFRGSFSLCFGCMAIKVKMGVPRRRFRGSMGGRNFKISNMKSEETKSAVQGVTFVNVCEFGAQ